MDFREALQAGKIGIGGASDHWSRLFGQKVLGGYVQGYAEGAIASFNDGVNAPVDKLLVTITPIQTGTGDPSPDNVRPISGWTGAQVAVSNKAPNAEKQYVIEPTQAGSGDPSPENIRPISGVNITGIGTVYGGTLDITSGILTVEWNLMDLSNRQFTYDTRGNYPFFRAYFPSSADYTNGRLRLVCNKYKAISNSSAAVFRYSNNNYCITLNSTTTGGNYEILMMDSNYTDATTFNASLSDAYVIYKLATPITYQLTDAQIAEVLKVYSITWQTEAGTVYGGELDVTSGVLTVTYAITQLVSSMGWNYGESAGRHRVFTQISGMKANTAQVYSEVFKGSDTLPLPSYPTAWEARTNSTPAIVIGLPSDYSLQDWKNLLDNETIHLVYQLSTPITYHLTPTEVTTLLGTNNIWADTGDVKVWYKKKK